MSNDAEQTIFSTKGVVLNTVLSLFFFLFMREVLVPHVPSEDPTAIMIVSSMTSFCMTGVFWIAANMLLVTWVDYNQKKKS